MAHDTYDKYFTEKLWNWLPAHYRHEDGLGDNPGVLRALIQVVASQAANMRRSQDRLWDDQFIDLCDDWTVPYIGDLLSTRMLPALNTRGRRVDVAKTIYYRRRKGTLAVLEDLISDITGWEGKVVELFRSLGRTPHRLDNPGCLPMGRYSHTPQGGTVAIGSTDAAELIQDPFDEYAYTPDMRKAKGNLGWYQANKLAFHLYTTKVVKLIGVQPALVNAGNGYTFDPSERNVPLYMLRNRPEDWSQWESATKGALPEPITCGFLSQAAYRLTETALNQLINDLAINPLWVPELESILEMTYPSEKQFKDALLALPQGAQWTGAAMFPSFLEACITRESGKYQLYPRSLEVRESAGGPVAREKMEGGDLSAWGTIHPDKEIIIDPKLGRWEWIGAGSPSAPEVDYSPGFYGLVGAGAYPRPSVSEIPVDITLNGGGPITAANLRNNGATRIEDSSTYSPISDKLSVRNLKVVAASSQRPYLRMLTKWVLNTGVNRDSEVYLEGLWLGAEDNESLIFRGDFEKIELVSCTLDPGGERGDVPWGTPLPTVRLSVEGKVECLHIKSCILGPLVIDGYVEELWIEDSIVQSINATPALQTQNSALTRLERVTVQGAGTIHRLRATDCIMTGLVQVEDAQQGCFRFSAAPLGSRLPKPFESFAIQAGRQLFRSRRFGHPHYFRLRQSAPGEILTGAENGSEMGAYHSELHPIKLDSLKMKSGEYMPFGLVPIMIEET